MIDVSLLGTGGMMPLPNRYLTSLLCRINGKMILIDCGEATQVTMKSLGWGYKNIDVICFTHFHGDHISGLPGLLLTIGNSDRVEPITIIGPVGIEKVVESLCIIANDLPFKFEFIEIESKPFNNKDEKNQIDADDNVVFKIDDLIIRALPLDHRISCFGYSLELCRKGKFNIELAKKLQIPVNLFSKLQKGESVTYEENLYTPEMVMGESRKSLKVSYITDTRPVLEMPKFVEGSDLFICEGLYGDNEKFEKARNHKHMIYREAAQIAKDGKVSELWLTHFSPAMVSPKEFLKNATDIFPNTIVGKDRMCKNLIFED